VTGTGCRCGLEKVLREGGYGGESLLEEHEAGGAGSQEGKLCGAVITETHLLREGR